jgi:predicted permease
MEQVLRTLLPFLLGGMTLAAIGLRFEPISDTGVKKAARLFTQWVIWVAMPAVVLLKIHALPAFSFTQPEVFLPISQPWLHFALVAGLCAWIGKRLSWSPGITGALTLTIGFGNTSFVGIPLLNAILGPDSLPTAILLDQLGSFFILSSLGVATAQYYQARARQENATRKRKRDFLIRPLKFPPFLALLLAFALRGLPYPEALQSALTFLSTTLTPAALLSVGLSIRLSALKRREVRVLLVIAVFAKLIELPALEGALYFGAAQLFEAFDPLVLKTLLLEASMATMIMAGVLAASSDLEPELSQLIVGVSIPISLITVPAWNWIWGHWV